jgi:hypothetical protein
MTNATDAVLIYYSAPDAAEPVRVVTQTEPVMVSPADEAVEALRQRKPALVWPHERDAVLAALSVERVTS